MENGVSLWVARLLKAAAALAGLAFLGIYLFLVLHRIHYPYELEWMEGAHVDYVRRILAGQPIYVKPSLDFTPFIYTPLYFYVSALVAMVTGFDLPGRGFFPLRLVSVLSSLGCLVVIFALVRRETGNAVASLLASCLFIATFRASGACLDVARLDTLFLLFLLLAVYALRRARSLPGFALAALLIWLSFLTKQAALFAFLPLMVWAVWANPRGGLVLAGVVGALVIGSTLIADHVSGGWYRYYVFLLPGQHAVVPKWWLGYWTGDLLAKLPVALGLAIAFLAGEGGRTRRAEPPAGADRRPWGFYLALFAGLVGGTWVSRLNEGAVENVLFPAYAGLSILFGLALHAAERWAERADVEVVHWLRAGLWVLCLIQFFLLRYPVAPRLPTPADRQAWDGFMQRLARWEGEVYLPYHGYLTSLVGKPTHAHLAAVRDVIIHKRGSADDLLLAELEKAMRERRFRVIVMDTGDQPPGMAGNYQLVGQAFARLDDGWPVAGRPVRPERIYVPVAGKGGAEGQG